MLINANAGIGKKAADLAARHMAVVKGSLVAGEPKVSVLVAAYNHRKYITQALESIELQRVDFSVEIIVADDYSTDGTREIVKDFQRKHPDRVVALLPDRNLWKPFPGFNTGLLGLSSVQYARGKYLAFLDGDDWWSSRDKLAKQVAVMEQNLDCAICCHRVDVIDGNNGAKIREHPPSPYQVHVQGTRELLECDFIQTCSALVRREWLPVFFDSMYGVGSTDWLTWLLVSTRGNIRYIDENMACYRVHQNGAWNRLAEAAQCEAICDVLNVVADFLPAQYAAYARQNIRKTRRGFVLRTALGALRADEYWKLRIVMLKHLFTDPLAFTEHGRRWLLREALTPGLLRTLIRRFKNSTV